MEQETFEKIKNKEIETVLEKYFGENITLDEKMAMREFFTQFFNEIIKGERDIFLEKSPNNKANGYYQRELTSGLWKLNINVPWDRNGEFCPCVLSNVFLNILKR